ncbi:MAG: cytochrome c peroxidase, partial [Burkholderiaceae bacterium]
MSSAAAMLPQARAHAADEADLLDAPLAAALRHHGFTGAVQSTLARRVGRPIDARLANLGRLLFFDTATGLRGDNACAGCHAPASGMGDSQSIAIGVQSNGVVGPGRTGPRNQRRTPSVINSAFFPKLMWNGRFAAASGDPFDNSQGFHFPAPEGTTAFPPNDLSTRHLLVAQAHIPPTELNEAAGFTGTRGTLDPRFDAFDDGVGGVVPAPDATGFRNEPIRQTVLNRLNETPGYRARFAAAFAQVKDGAPIDFKMFAQAIAEFEFTLVRANAPIDRFARGDRSALTSAEKRGALLFFGKANCVACHAVAGASNQMFSDFQNRNIGVPQIAAEFGVGKGNSIFDGPGEDEDFGAAQVSGAIADRYKFRTSPLRNVALQPAFFHNGAFTRLGDAIRHHLDVRESVRRYNPKRAGVADDLTRRVGPMAGVLGTLDALVQNPMRLSDPEFRDLVVFVGNGLLDPQARPKSLCRLVPKALPSS